MALKGFPREILIEKLNALAIKELATGTERWECGSIVQRDSSLFRMGLVTRIKNVTRSWTKLYEFAQLAKECERNRDGKAGKYAKNIRILSKLVKDFMITTLEEQKNLYKREHNIYNSHSCLEIPLDKRPGLNAIYDDFTAFFLFFDNISTIGKNMGTFLESLGTDKGKVKYFIDHYVDDKSIADQLVNAKPKERKAIWVAKHGMDAVDYFESLDSVKERTDYVIDNTEFDHCTIGGTLNPNWAIGVYGDVEPSVIALENAKGNSLQVLPCEYSDFPALTLADTLKVKSQDLMQILQSRIDLDKENLQIIDERSIGGDFYQLKRIDPKMLEGSQKSNEYLIRFECPSTGRPYHIDIDENMLRFSNLYVKGDPKSYIEAWWHITHGGVDPRETEYVIRT